MPSERRCIFLLMRASRTAAVQMIMGSLAVGRYRRSFCIIFHPLELCAKFEVVSITRSGRSNSMAAGCSKASFEVVTS